MFEYFGGSFFRATFTWTNKRDGKELIMERLDRAYVLNDWFDEFPEGRVFHEPLLCSDHAAIMYDTDYILDTSTRPYQIEAWFLLFPEIKDLIIELWPLIIEGSTCFLLAKTLRRVRTGLQRWFLSNKTFWGVNWRGASRAISNEVKEIDTFEEGNMYTDLINNWLPRCTLEFNFWKQR